MDSAALSASHSALEALELRRGLRIDLRVTMARRLTLTAARHAPVMRSPDFKRLEHLAPGNHLAEDGVLAVEIPARRQRDVDLAVGPRRIAHVRDADGARAVRPLRAEISATPIGLPLAAAAPRPHSARFESVAGLRIAELHDEARQRAVHALTVVETAVDQRHDVRDGLGAPRPETFER